MTTQLQQCREVAAALDEEVTEWRRKDAEWHEHRSAAEKALHDMPFVMDNYRAALARAEAAEEELEAERETNAETDGFLDRLIAALDHPIRGDEVFLPEIVETATALRARAEAAERERDEYKIQRDLFRVSDAELTARVAELEAQLAAQGWRPVTITEPSLNVMAELIIVGYRGHDGYWHYPDGPEGLVIRGWRPVPVAAMEENQQ